MKKIIILLVFISCVCSASASHLRAGQITVEQQPGSRTCQITVSVFTNIKNTNVLFGGEGTATLDFGDKSTTFQVPTVQNTVRYDFDPSGFVATASYTVSHIFPSFGSFLISYREANRNQGVLNMDNSVNTEFYIETFITITENGAPYETPVLLMDRPVLKGVIHLDYSESLACIDVNNYQLYYQLVTPKGDRGVTVMNYVFPENLSIDRVSGLVTWDTKFKGAYSLGEFTFAVKIYQIKDNKIVGYMVRDFQFILDDEAAKVPSLDGSAQSNSSVFVPESTTTRLRVAAGSAVTSKIELQVESELVKFSENFSYTIEDSTHEDVKYKVAKITVINDAKIVRDTPYIITVRGIFDNAITKDLSYIIGTRDIDFENQLPSIITGLEDNEQPFQINVSPNPVKDFLEISNKNNYTVSINIYDLAGRALQRQTIDSTAVIDLRPLTSGVYVCVVAKGNDVAFYKILKE